MYTIYAGGICIFDDADPSLETKLISPTLQLNAGAAGSLTMTVPKTNAGHGSINILGTTISVRRDGTEIWRGRVLSESRDLWGSRKLMCEGALAWLNDTVQPSIKYAASTPGSFISALLSVHNSKVLGPRKISLGTVTVTDPAGAVDRTTNGESTMEALQKLTNELGGVLRVRFGGTALVLDYLSQYPANGSYDLQFGTPTAGGLNYSTGATYTSSAMYHTDYISLDRRPAGSKLQYSRIYTTASSVIHGIAFYDEGKTYISGIQSVGSQPTTHYGSYTADIPGNAAYVRFSTLNPANYSGFLARITWSGGEAAQSLDLEENLLDFTRGWDSSDFCTVILPRGARLESEDSSLQRYLDISGCTAPTGYSILDSVYLSKTAAQSAYGRIERVVDFSDIGAGLDPESVTYAADLATAQGQLLAAAQDYLADKQYDDMSLELTALDLHITDRAVQAWNLLDVVQVHARPYFGAAGKTFAILGMSIPLDAPEKTKYTLGPEAVPKKRRVLSLTKQQTRTASELADSVESARTAGQDYTDGEVVSVKHWVDSESGVYTEISDAMGDNAHLYVRLEGIDTAVETADGHATQAQITADGILGKVSYVDDNDVRHWTVANLKTDGFYIYDSGSSATRTLITGSMIDVDTIHANKLYGGTIYFMINTGTDPQTGEPVFAQVGTFIFNETQIPDVYQIGFGQFGAVDFGGVTDVYVHSPDTIYFSSLGKSLQDLLDEKADV